MSDEEQALKALYSVAVLAIKQPPQFHAYKDAAGKLFYRWQPTTSELLNTAFAPEYVLIPDYTFASTEAEAIEICLERARAKYPADEGWVEHAAGAGRIMSMWHIASMLIGVWSKDADPDRAGDGRAD